MTSQEPGEIKLTSGNEVIRVTSDGFHYNEQYIEDAGKAHYLLVEFLQRAMPDVAWQHVDKLSSP